jgi:lipoprotein LprG
VQFPRRGRRVRCGAVVAGLIAVGLVLAGCTGSSGSDGGGEGVPDPAAAIEAATVALAQTTGVHLAIESSGVDGLGSGLVSATGTLLSDGAFDGTLDVITLGTQVTVPVIAVDGLVHAQLPFTTGWQVIDPADYGVSDPAQLLSAEAGLGSMLAAMTNLSAGEQVRGGVNNAEVLSTYSGVLPGEAAQGLVLTATGDMDASALLTESGELRQLVVTGDFYGSGTEVTYTLTLTDYGTNADITAP